MQREPEGLKGSFEGVICSHRAQTAEDQDLGLMVRIMEPQHQLECTTYQVSHITENW